MSAISRLMDRLRGFPKAISWVFRNHSLVMKWLETLPLNTVVRRILDRL